MKGYMRNVSNKAGLRAKIAKKLLGHRGIYTLHCTTLIAHQVNMNVIVDCVIGRRTVTDMGMSNKANLFQDLEIAINGGQIHAAGSSLHMSQNFVGRSVTKILDGLEN